MKKVEVQLEYISFFKDEVKLKFTFFDGAKKIQYGKFVYDYKNANDYVKIKEVFDQFVKENEFQVIPDANVVLSTNDVFNTSLDSIFSKYFCNSSLFCLAISSCDGSLFSLKSFTEISSGFLFPSPISINKPTMFLTIYLRNPVPTKVIISLFRFLLSLTIKVWEIVLT